MKVRIRPGHSYLGSDLVILQSPVAFDLIAQILEGLLLVGLMFSIITRAFLDARVFRMLDSQ